MLFILGAVFTTWVNRHTDIAVANLGVVINDAVNINISSVNANAGININVIAAMFTSASVNTCVAAGASNSVDVTITHDGIAAMTHVVISNTNVSGANTATNNEKSCS